jgi:8-oxo-dGTP pyrophosphatase MutT (NUDIX family)
MKKAAAVLIRNKEDLILAVSRKDNPDDFGLPGGNVDPGENYRQTAIRETFEETGLVIDDLECVFTRDEGEYSVRTYIPRIVSGEIKTTEKGVVKWITEEKLLEGSFGEYNKQLLWMVSISKG